MEPVTIGEFKYQIGKLTPRQQIHLTRRLAPILGSLAREAGGKTEADILALGDAETIAMAFGPIATALASMKERDVDYIIDLCLGAVSRLAGDTWTPVLNPTTKAIMYEDIDMGGMLSLCGAVIQRNLGNFLPGQLLK